MVRGHVFSRQYRTYTVAEPGMDSPGVLTVREVVGQMSRVRAFSGLVLPWDWVGKTEANAGSTYTSCLDLRTAWQQYPGRSRKDGVPK